MSLSKVYDSLIGVCVDARALPASNLPRDRLRSLTGKLLAAKLSWVVDVDAAGEARRVLVMPNKSNVLGCGAVLSFPDLRIMAAMPRVLTKNTHGVSAMTDLSRYDVYPAHDGTVLTLYYYGGKWVMASARSCDIGGLKWGSDKTYEELFAEVVGEYPDFSVEALDTKKSYTIGFHHREVHPLPGDENAAWFIQAANVTDAGVLISRDESIGLPTYPPIHLDTLRTFKDIRARCDSALSKYIMGGATLKEQPNYGYILRSRNHNYPDILVESTLMAALRELLYDMSNIKCANPAITRSRERFRYMALRAYLDYDNRITFMNLFGNEEYGVFGATLRDVANIAVGMLNGAAPTTPREDACCILASGLLAGLRAVNISLSSDDTLAAGAVEIVIDFMTDPVNTDLIYACLPPVQ